jgi:ABC-type thiamine transport system ATPase subunit
MSKYARSLEAAKAFTPTAPVDEKSLFSGRTNEIMQVINTIYQKGQHAIIYGERGVGKTSLANVLTLFLNATPGTILSPRVNCDASDTFESIIKKVFSEINLITKKRSIGFSGQPEPSQLNAVDLLEHPFSPDAVRKALSILATQFIPILIFDEFDRLQPKIKNLFADTIKTLSDHAIGATVLLVGVADSVDELIEAHQSVERALMQIRMPRMSPDEIKGIINIGLGRLSMTIAEDALHRITMLTQGLPHYAHLLGLHSSRNAIDGDRVLVLSEDVFGAIQKALGGTQQTIQRAWHKATMSPKRDNLFADVLLACAMARTDELGYFAAADVRDPVRLITGKHYEIPSFSQHLKEFTQLKRGPILQKIGTPRRFRFRFVNPLMQPYIIMKGVAEGKIPFN